MLRLGFRYGEIRAMYENEVAAWLIVGNETAATEGNDSEGQKTYKVRREKQK